MNLGRFAECHKRLFAKMESIDDVQKKIAARRQQVASSNNDVLNRLATPKNQRETTRRRF